MRLVLDTNVLVSGIINPEGPPGRIVDLLRTATLQLVVDDRILSEYHAVLLRNYFRRYLTEQETHDSIEFLRRESFYTSCRVVVSGLPDPSDAPFLEVALSEKATLVTGNIRHFPAKLCGGCRIHTPRQFLGELQAP